MAKGQRLTQILGIRKTINGAAGMIRLQTNLSPKSGSTANVARTTASIAMEPIDAALRKYWNLGG
jgi:hypothetical protein